MSISNISQEKFNPLNANLFNSFPRKNRFRRCPHYLSQIKSIQIKAWLIHDESVDLWLNAIHSESDTRISQTINVLESMAYKTEYNANGHQIHMLVY